MPSERFLVKCMQGVCWVSAGTMPGLLDEVSAMILSYSSVYAKCMQGVCYGHPRSYKLSVCKVCAGCLLGPSLGLVDEVSAINHSY